MSECYLGKILWDALMLLFSLFDHALQSTVGECVALVELQITLVSEETASSFWSDVPDPIRGDNCGREVDKVLSSSFQWKTLVPNHWELRRFSNEHLEGTVLLVKGTEGHCVGVEVQGEPQSILSSLSRLYLLYHLIPLHIFHKSLVV